MASVRETETLAGDLCVPAPAIGQVQVRQQPAIRSPVLSLRHGSGFRQSLFRTPIRRRVSHFREQPDADCIVASLVLPSREKPLRRQTGDDYVLEVRCSR
jgi:hypothetical protein